MNWTRVIFDILIFGFFVYIAAVPKTSSNGTSSSVLSEILKNSGL